MLENERIQKMPHSAHRYPEVSLPLPSVSVVLNVFKRGKNFSKQLDAVRAQKTPPKEILIWENGADKVETDGQAGVSRARSDENLGVWARFSYALNASSEFVWLIDDDTIPGPGWLENALRTFRSNPGVIGSRGLKFSSSTNYLLYEEYGPNRPSEKVEEVDIVGHNWVIPREWLGYFWSEYGQKFPHDLAGEDIHLSFAVQKHLGLGTFVPPHPAGDRDSWGELSSESDFDGTDKAAISQSSESMRRFERAYAHYVKLGFEPVCVRTQTEKRIDRALGSAISRWPYQAQRIANLVNLRKTDRN
jgi:glycosyltransferase involved in cell wall biosynthesis